MASYIIHRGQRLPTHIYIGLINQPSGLIYIPIPTVPYHLHTYLTVLTVLTEVSTRARARARSVSQSVSQSVGLHSSSKSPTYLPTYLPRNCAVLCCAGNALCPGL